MENEEWRWVLGYEGRYEVSNDGRLRSHVVGDYVKPLTVRTEKRGYRFIVLTRPGDRSRGCWVHRLVARAFVPNPLDLPEVNHLDGDKANNLFTNLEWTTRSGNNKHAFDIGLRKAKPLYGDASHFSKLKSEDVLEIRRTYKKGNGTALAKKYGISLSHLSDIVYRKSWPQI